MSRTWGDVYNRHLRVGRDHGDAAYRADEWQKRQDKRQPLPAQISRITSNLRSMSGISDVERDQAREAADMIDWLAAQTKVPTPFAGSGSSGDE